MELSTIGVNAIFLDFSGFDEIAGDEEALKDLKILNHN